jgi:7,8-dihydropterin-6-yl-methyl-4-(beta-D-ribofuranosyl)aminobenzene 5'-phosphate synthase
MLRRLTVLCENSVSKSVQAIGEHGFSCFIETDAGAYLFDTGQGLGLLHNADLLNISLNDLKGVILSHGHFDHTGGLRQVLSRTGSLPVYGHPELFRERFWVGKFEQRANGIPFSRVQLETDGACFDLSADFREISPGIWLTGEVPRRTDFEQVDSALHYRDKTGELRHDQIEDDCSVVVESAKGLILLLGCAHAGLANILHHVVDVMGENRIYAVLGGMHLGPVSDEQFEQTVGVLKRYNVSKIGVGHCTGQRRSADLYAQFPTETTFLSVGSVLSMPALHK